MLDELEDCQNKTINYDAFHQTTQFSSHSESLYLYRSNHSFQKFWEKQHVEPKRKEKQGVNILFNSFLPLWNIVKSFLPGELHIKSQPYIHECVPCIWPELKDVKCKKKSEASLVDAISNFIPTFNTYRT